RAVGEVGEARDACVVDQHVQTAEAFDRSVQDTLPVVRARDVGRDREDVRVLCGKRGSQGIDLVLGTGREDNPRTGRGGLLRQAAADPTGGPRYQDAPTAQIALHATTPVHSRPHCMPELSSQRLYFIQLPQASSSYQTTTRDLRGFGSKSGTLAATAAVYHLQPIPPFFEASSARSIPLA